MDQYSRDKIVMDYATGLMWQKTGSTRRLTYKDAQGYIENLNHTWFGDYADWRMPTVKELISLLEPEKQSNGLYINPIFDATTWYWTSSGSTWCVHSGFGAVIWYRLDDAGSVRAVRSWQD